MTARSPFGGFFQSRRFVFRAGATAAVAAAYFLVGRLQPLGSPRAFHGRLAATALTVLLVVYPLVALAAAVGLGLVAARLVWGRTRPVWAVRGLLVCGSLALAITAAEATAKAWLAFRHRDPTVSLRLPKSSPSAPVEIVVIGGSSALGAPYEDWLSVGAVVGRALERAIPGRRFHVNVLAEKGASLEMTHRKLAALDRAPDVLIVYSGHNEFLARFSIENQTFYYDDERPAARAWAALERTARVSAVVRLARENLEKERVGLVPSRALGTVERTIGRPAASAAETQAVLADFAARLESITAFCERIGCLPILVVPPGNESADPNQSYASPRTRHDQRRALFDRLAAVRALEDRDAAAAIAAYEAVLVEQPTLAVAHHRLARLYDRAGSIAKAVLHYISARDYDGLPLRATSAIEDAYREVARRRGTTAILIDGPRIFRSATARGVIDQALVHDLVHPTLAGTAVLARAILEELKRRKTWDWPETAAVEGIEPLAIAREFDVDAAVWAEVCQRVAAQYEMIEFLTVDPAERVAWRDRFLDARRRIQAGARPEEIGLPGVGTVGRETSAGP